jgi:hypothetical protein
MLRAPDQRQNSTDAIEGHPLRVIGSAVAGGTTGLSRLIRVSPTYARWRVCSGTDIAASPVVTRANAPPQAPSQALMAKSRRRSGPCD